MRVFGRQAVILVAWLAQTSACATKHDEPAPQDRAQAGSSAGGAAGASVSAAGAGGAGTSDAGGGTGAAGQAGISPPAGGASPGAPDAGVTDGAAGDAGDAFDPGEPFDESCLEGITDYIAAGPFEHAALAFDQVKVWAPVVRPGCKVPIVHFANGTGAACASTRGLFVHLASHGFIAACYESTQTGLGTQCIDAVARVYEELPELAGPKLGFAGQHTGGAAAFLCTAHATQMWGNTKLYAGHAFAPAHGNGAGRSDWQDVYATITSPMFMINGSADSLVSASWVGRGYELLPATTEAYWYEGTGVPHIPVPIAALNESAVTWFRWQLLGDAAACEHFKAMPGTDRWDLQEQRNVAPCE
jgi:hypothetical protein